jgi:hypothetical protein
MYLWRPGNFFVYKAVKVRSPDHFVGVGMQAERRRKTLPVKVHSLPAFVNDRLKGADRSFPEAPGPVVFMLIFRLNDEHGFIAQRGVKQVISQA